MINETFWAAGASVVLMVSVEEKDGDNSSSTLRETLLSNWELNGGIACTCIDHRAITTADAKRFTVYALQATCGGRFPSRATQPDVILHLLTAITNTLLLADPPRVSIGVVQARSCVRSVSASNGITISKLADNAAAAHGLGGIGMTCIWPNASLLLHQAGLYSGGQSGSSMPHTPKDVPHRHVRHLLQGNAGVERQLLRDCSLSRVEAAVIWVLAAAAAAAAATASSA